MKYLSLLCFCIPLCLCLFFFHDPVFADSFYSSGGDITQCSLSIAPVLGYTNLPAEYAFDPKGGIQYDASEVSGLTDSIFTQDGLFSNYATDIFPNAQRFVTNGVTLRIPPQTTVHVYGIVRNSNPYPLHLNGGTLFTSLTDPSDGNLFNLDPLNLSSVSLLSASTIFNGTKEIRMGYGMQLPNLGVIQANQDSIKDLYSFSTITPLQVQRDISYQFNTDRELVISVKLQVQNVSNYEEDNLSVHDAFQNTYDFSTSFSLKPHTATTFTYGGDLGIIYGSYMAFPPAVISDPNTHTEIFQQGETSYEQNPDAVSVFVARDDESSPANWSANQSSLPILSSKADMSVTLLPYTLYSSVYELQLSPHLTLSKTQNKTTDDIQVRVGDHISYSLTLTNDGNTPAVHVIVVDRVYTNMNVIDSGGGNVCIYADQLIEGYVCHHSILWYLPYLDPGQSVTFTYTEAVANTAFTDQLFPNSALEQNNLDNVISSNEVDAYLIQDTSIVPPVIPSIITLSGFSSLSTGSVLGVVWNDLNHDGKYEVNEHAIPHAHINLSYGSASYDIYTDSLGRYEVDGLPLLVPIQVTIDIPLGFHETSTYQKYIITLSHISFQTVSVTNKIVHIQDGIYFNRADLGVYNLTLADTGENILPVIIMAIFLFCILIQIILRNKEKRY